MLNVSIQKESGVGAGWLITDMAKYTMDYISRNSNELSVGTHFQEARMSMPGRMRNGDRIKGSNEVADSVPARV